MIRSSRRNEAGISTKELSDGFITAFMEDACSFGIKPTFYKILVLLTTWMKSLHLMSTLVDKGFAYVSEGDGCFE